MSPSWGVAAAAGWLVDQVAGEPPTSVHPVAWFGSAMHHLERRTYRDHRAAGILHVTIGAGVAAATGTVLDRTLGRSAATALAASISIAGRMLASEADRVLASVDADDLAAARDRLPALVGRDTRQLAEDDIVRAVIESLAENTVDAVTAPVFWAVVAGARGVLVHRAVNTLDAMIGHRSDRYHRFGWAAARLDDALNWVPARLSAVAVAVTRPTRAGAVGAAVHRDASRHPSPNGGVIEAAFAGALGVRLGGTNTYEGRPEDRGALGAGRIPSRADARAAVRIARAVGAVAAAMALFQAAVRCRLRRSSPA